MLEYHAAYYRTDDGWYTAEVLDFPGALSQGRTLKSARRMIRDALRMLAECMMEERRTLPKPNPRVTDKTADFLEPIRLGVRAHTGVMHETSQAPRASPAARLHSAPRRRRSHARN
jgi:predicted RNase H-like HicB family nuclease